MQRILSAAKSLKGAEASTLKGAIARPVAVTFLKKFLQEVGVVFMEIKLVNKRERRRWGCGCALPQGRKVSQGGYYPCAS